MLTLRNQSSLRQPDRLLCLSSCLEHGSLCSCIVIASVPSDVSLDYTYTDRCRSALLLYVLLRGLPVSSAELQLLTDRIESAGSLPYTECLPDNPQSHICSHTHITTHMHSAHEGDLINVSQRSYMPAPLKFAVKITFYPIF